MFKVLIAFLEHNYAVTDFGEQEWGFDLTPSQGFDPTCRPNGSHLVTFQDIHFWLTYPRFFKGDLASLFSIFERRVRFKKSF